MIQRERQRETETERKREMAFKFEINFNRLFSPTAAVLDFAESRSTNSLLLLHEQAHIHSLLLLYHESQRGVRLAFKYVRLPYTMTLTLLYCCSVPGKSVLYCCSVPGKAVLLYKKSAVCCHWLYHIYVSTKYIFSLLEICPSTRIQQSSKADSSAAEHLIQRQQYDIR